MSLTLKNIPNDWELKKLKDVSKFSNGKGHEKSIDENGQYIVVNSKFVSTNGQVKKFSNQKLSPLKIGDITMVMSDIPNGKAIAKCFIIDEDNRYTLNQRICSIQSNAECDNKFLYYVINRNKYYLAFDNGDSQTNLKKDEVLDCPIQFPPLPEQQKIADILSTVDAKIEVINQQIKETKELKNGLMQRLLTKGIGHTEFRDSPLGKIPKSWEIKSLESLVRITMGQSPSSSSYNQDGIGILLIQGNADIKNRLSKPRQWTSESTKQCDIGDILMTVRAPVGAIALSKHHACIGRGVCSIKPVNINKNYLYQYLMSFEQKWKSMEQGSTFTAVNSNDIKCLNIPLPSKIEQDKIADVLSLVDNKSGVLLAKKVNYKKLKKGLMQQLLTGKIRVNNLVEA